MLSIESSMEPIDRKFVASNSKSLLRCPGCSKEYSHVFNKNEEGSRHRPVLLGCGHSLCETCVWRKRNAVKCDVCLKAAPPLLSINAPPTSTSGVNVRDYYELSYFLLGKANDLKCFDKILDEPGIGDPDGTGDSMSLVRNCSECNSARASGECRKCDGFFCPPCFTAVHKHSRVLQTHHLQKFGIPRELHVDNHVFQLPFQRNCELHKLPRNIICHQCRDTNCSVCTERHHAGHKVETLANIRGQAGTAIPVTNCEKTAHLGPLNGWSAVLDAKEKLNTFTSEAMTEMSEFFSHLHGLLQVAEMHALAQLQESCQPSLMELNQALSKVKTYESVLRILHDTLKSGSQNQSGVPENIWLKKVIELVYENVEKMPVSVKITDIEANPYSIIKRDFDLSKVLGSMLKCYFKDPEIKIQFKTNLDVSGNLSGGSVSGEGNDSRKPKVPITFMTNTVNQISRSHLSLHSQEMQLGDPSKDLLRSFSALEISSPSQAGSFHQDTEEQDDKKWLVKVISIVTPTDFYMVNDKLAKRLHQELEVCASSLRRQSSKNLEIVVGQRYVAEIENRFYRVEVKQDVHDAGFFKAFLLDVGLLVEVESGSFRKMPKTLANIKCPIVHCGLKDLIPSKGATEWDPEATNLLKELVQDFNVEVVDADRNSGGDIVAVDFKVKNCNKYISVRESLLYTGMASSSPEGRLNVNRVASADLRYPKACLHFGDSFNIQMLHVENPQKFYVMRHDLEKHRCKQDRELQYQMDRVSFARPIFLGRKKLACAMYSDNGWNRARIDEILEDGYVLVFLVDEGVPRKVSWHQLYPLPEPLLDPELAIECCLADVETLPETGYMWTPQAIKSFVQLTSNPKLRMLVVHCMEDLAVVTLEFARGFNEGEPVLTNIGAQMVSQGHCISSGPASMLPTPPLEPREWLDSGIQEFIEKQKAQAVQAVQDVKLTPFKGPDNKKRNKRVVVNVLYVHGPDEFYVTLPHFQPAIKHLQKTVQAVASSMSRMQRSYSNWQAGDMCYVRAASHLDLDPLWHRGVIKGTQPPPCFQVQLRDLGEVVSVPINCLVKIDEPTKRVADSAKRCNLHGIKPAGGQTEYSPDAIDFFKDQIQAYHEILVTGHGHANNSLSVVLWGSHTMITGPFSPATTKYVNINMCLLWAGFAEKQINEDPDESVPDNISTRSGGTSKSMANKSVQSQLDKIDQKVSGAVELPDTVLNFQHDEGMPPLELLDDLGTETTGLTAPPMEWATPRECTKTLFMGIATNVNYEGNIFLTLATDKPYLELMRSRLEQKYKVLMESQHKKSYKPYTFVVGQPVVVSYHMDSLLYRGIVQRLQNSDGEYTVYYVDYGNMEKVKALDMLPYAPFPDLNAMCWLVTLYGVKPMNDKYTIKEMDTIHRQVVMQISSVRVMESNEEDPASLPSCLIKVNNQDLSAFMVDCGMAISTDTYLEGMGSLCAAAPQNLKAFKVFDELENFAPEIEENEVEEGPETNVDMQGKHDTFSTTQPPPSKKMFLVDDNQVDMFEDDQDVDCQEAAMKMDPNRFFYPSSVDSARDSARRDRRKATENFFSSAEADDEDADGELMALPWDKEEPFLSTFTSVSQMKPMDICSSEDAAKQLKRRIELHQKGMSQQVGFSPQDSSTVRSIFDGSASFKTHHLPAGVKLFWCTVDLVVSATELQISPCLSEFTKHDISLVQETKALIKEAKPLLQPKVGDVCLAKYSQDKMWYRATVMELQPLTKEATVFYVDFHDTEIVPFHHLKQMLEQLVNFPLRSFRVKLHGIKWNRNFGEKTVRQALTACVSKYKEAFARIHVVDRKPNDSIESDQQLFEVELFENKRGKKLVYQALIDSWMYQVKRSK
ncbi:hypothetical protein KR018_008051 [Drosophila ironensis]|nr:hypothetical protein KR018_008051 [Drosophila ironensis]